MAAERAETYEELRTRVLNRPFLAGPFGTAWQAAMGAYQDVQLDRLFQAKRVRWPEWCPTDALTYHASERGLERIPTETEAAHRRRLRTAWTIWQKAGSQQGHIDAFGWFGDFAAGTNLTRVVVRRRKDFSMPVPVGSPYVRTFARMVWASFDVVVSKPHPWVKKTWGGGWKWGDGTTWGSTATPAQVNLFRRLIWQFKSAHDTCVYIHVNLGNARLWGGGGKWGDGGKWGGGGGQVRWIVGEPHWKTRGLL